MKSGERARAGLKVWARENGINRVENDGEGDRKGGSVIRAR